MKGKPTQVYSLKSCPWCKSGYHLAFERNKERMDERVVCDYCGVAGPWSDYEYPVIYGKDPHLDSAEFWNKFVILVDKEVISKK